MVLPEGTSQNEFKICQMRALVTGSTGFIGAGLVKQLAESGIHVNALYRSENKAKSLKVRNVTLCKGDILDIESLRTAVKHCDHVYHVAAFTEVWAKDKDIIRRLNVEGTRNVLDVALENGIRDIVFTSTAGVLGPSISGIINENTDRSIDYFLEYERTKAEAEELVSQYVKKGLNIKIVNPTRVYGPGFLGKSNSVTIMIKSYCEGKWHIIPGNGKSIGNYVYVDDVINGHILAMELGKSGERYLLGGENIDYLGFFNTLKKISGMNTWLIKVPLFAMLLISGFAMFLNKLFGISPFITPALVKKFNYNWEVSSRKAQKELDYNITSFSDGMKKTLEWIKE